MQTQSRRAQRVPRAHWNALAAITTALLASSAYADITFLHHFDNGLGGGGGDADYAVGNPAEQIGAPLGNGGVIVSSPAKFGNALLRGNGSTVGGRLEYQTASNFNLQRGTIDLWLHSSTLTTNHSFLGLWGLQASVGPGDIRMYLYDVAGVRNLGAYMIGDDGVASRWEIEAPIPAAGLTNNAWHHVAWEWDLAAGATATFWDGQPLRNTASFGTVHYEGTSIPELFHIGENQFGSVTWNGHMDEFRITDRREYNGVAFTPPVAPYQVSGPVAAQWAVDSDGDWSTASNWIGGVPDTFGSSASFGPVITAPRIVTLGAPVTVSTISFDSANAYTVSGSSSIALSGLPGGAINVASGSHTIAAPITLASSATITVQGASNTLTLAGEQSAAPGVALLKLGDGTLATQHVRVDALQIQAGRLRVNASGSTGSASGTSRMNSLAIGSGAALDLTNNGLVVDYSGSSPLSTIRSWILVGVGGNEGILSSLAAGNLNKAIGYAEASDLGLSAFLGQSVDPTSVLLRWTLRGDANLSGNVDFSDLLTLAQHYNQSADWHAGDFFLDGTCDFGDLLVLAQNYGASVLSDEVDPALNFDRDWALALSMVPEPATTILLAAPMFAVRRRRSVKSF